MRNGGLGKEVEILCVLLRQAPRPRLQRALLARKAEGRKSERPGRVLLRLQQRSALPPCPLVVSKSL